MAQTWKSFGPQKLYPIDAVCQAEVEVVGSAQHLRGVLRESDDPVGRFNAEHLGGAADLVDMIAAAVHEEIRRTPAGRKERSMSFRPDHWQSTLDEKHLRVGQASWGFGRPRWPAD